MPFISKKQIFNNRQNSIGVIIWFHYRRWQHTKNPIIFQLWSDTKYAEGLAVKYLSPQTAFKIRDTLTKAQMDQRRTAFSRMRFVKNTHPIAYKRCYRKYFLKYIVLLGRWEIPLTDLEKDKTNKIMRQRPEFRPEEEGRKVPKGLTKPK